PPVAAVVDKLLAKRPEDRYPSARALIDALDDALRAPQPAAASISSAALLKRTSPEGESRVTEAYVRPVSAGPVRNPSRAATAPAPPMRPTEPARKRRRWMLRGAAVAGLMAVIGVFLFHFIGKTTPRAQACFVMVGASYADDLAVPHNAYGWRGLTDLHAWATGDTTPAAGRGAGAAPAHHPPPIQPTRSRGAWH